MAMKLARAVITGLGTLPIWFYLLHWLLKANGAGDLQMFLFWVYIPFTFVGLVLTIILTEK